MKDFNKLGTSELLEYRNAAKLLFDKYTNDLTTYSTLNNDKYFERITSSERALFNKKDKAWSIVCAIDEILEKRILSDEDFK